MLHGDPSSISPVTTALADYVAKTLDRELPADVVARTKLHVLDTIAAMVSGSRLKPGDFAARYVDSLGGKPQAMVIGTGIVTSAVNAALANAMAAHADETDDTNPDRPGSSGCGAVSAALATAELAGRTGSDLLRAVTLGLRHRRANGLARSVSAQGSRRHSPSCLTTTFVATAAAAAMLRLDPRQVRHTFSYAAQQASGIGFWTRDREHVEKAFDFGGMGARNGVMAATMVAMGFSAVEDPFSGNENIYTALADKPAPEKLLAELGIELRRLRHHDQEMDASDRRCSRCSIPSRRCSTIPACAPTTSSTSRSTCRPTASASSTTARSPISACSTSSR